MTDLFFFGTLRHLPLLAMVLGREIPAAALSDAELPDHAVFWADGQTFPTIEPRPGETAPGLLLEAASAADVARLEYYEGGFGYDLKSVQVRRAAGDMRPAWMFCARAGRWQAGAVWSLDDWAVHWGRISVRAASEAMAWYGRISAEDLADRFGAIRGRAGAWVAATDRPPDPQRDLARDVIVERHRHRFINYLAVEEMDLRFRRHDGTRSASVNRDALMVGHASVVLPYDPVADRVLLIQQFRAPVYIGGDPAPWLWEPVAGMIDPGETPAQTARREAREEAGLDLTRLEPVGGVYTSSGTSSEYQHFFVAIVDLAEAEGRGGLESEGEDILARTFRFDELMQAVDEGRARNAQLLILALWLARHRERLRTLP